MTEPKIPHHEMNRLTNFIKTAMKRRISDPPDVENVRAAAMAMLKELDILGISGVKVVDVKLGDKPDEIVATIEVPGWTVNHIYRPKEPPREEA